MMGESAQFSDSASAPPTMASLRLRTEKGEERVLLTSEPLVIGRSPDCDLVLSDSRLSRKHARVEYRTLRYWIVDMGSQNGTYRNGVRIRGAPLKPGDVLTLGSTTVIFEAAAEDPDAHAVTLPIKKESRTVDEGFTLLASLTAQINRDPTSPDLFMDLVDAAVQLTGGQRGFLILCHRDGMQFAAARGIEKSELDRPEFEVSWSIAVKVGTEGEPLLTMNALSDPRFENLASVEQLGLRSVLCVPVRSASQILGVIYVDHRVEDSVFTGQDITLLRMFADQAAIAITNRNLVQSLKEKALQVESLNQRLKHELHDRDETISSLRHSLDAQGGDAYFEYEAIVGASKAITDLKQLLRKVSPSEFTVLIEGESGTGKELVARCIHRNSTRFRQPFVTINCATIPETLLENELFGHVRGAFSGADRPRKGLFEAAHKGTLFLDEVSEMTPAMQSRLLRVVQDGEVRPVGGKDAIRVDVRIVAASNRDLAGMVASGEFREDLFYRLRVLTVPVPPLRRRREDLPTLIEHFLSQACGGAPIPPVPAGMMAAFEAYRWPGNVRELENQIRRLLVMGEGGLDEALLPEHILDSCSDPSVSHSEVQDLGELVEAIEVREITRALARADGNKSRAAELLGITRFTLQRKLDKYGLKVEET
jgi:transcriptional regulator with GAF, ATPase, and Fis domain